MQHISSNYQTQPVNYVQEINLTWHWALYKAGKYIMQAECWVLECESCGKYSNHWAIKGENYIVLGCDTVYFGRQVPKLWSQEVPINAGHI
jgi:hypothetical protein